MTGCSLADQDCLKASVLGQALLEVGWKGSPWGSSPGAAPASRQSADHHSSGVWVISWSGWPHGSSPCATPICYQLADWYHHRAQSGTLSLGNLCHLMISPSGEPWGLCPRAILFSCQLAGTTLGLQPWGSPCMMCHTLKLWHDTNEQHRYFWHD